MQMCLFLCMGGNSTTWMNTAILVTCMRNFRTNRGPVSGILKGFVGLSTAIFTDVCNALFSDSSSNFVMMLAIIPLLVCLTAMIFLREVPLSTNESDISDESKYFNMFNIVAVIIAVYLLAHDLIGSLGHVYDVVFTVLLLALLAIPLGIPVFIMIKSRLSSKSKADIEGQNVENTEPLLSHSDNMLIYEPTQEVVVVGSEEGAKEFEEVKKLRPVLGEEHTIIEALKTVDFWVLFVSFLCGVGTGMAVINNMGQMGSSLGYSDVSMFVSLVSIMGFFGRITSGTVSEYCIK